MLAGVTAAPKNVGWLYTQSATGAVFFDADLAGYSSYEKITVCDNKSDGRGIRASLVGTHPNGGYQPVPRVTAWHSSGSMIRASFISR